MALRLLVCNVTNVVVEAVVEEAAEVKAEELALADKLVARLVKANKIKAAAVQVPVVGAEAHVMLTIPQNLLVVNIGGGVKAVSFAKNPILALGRTLGHQNQPEMTTSLK